MKPNISTAPGIYLHIPFCEHKCGYCDFYSVTDMSSRASFVDYLIKEMRLLRKEIEIPQAFDTVYLGGGTPSLLSAAELERLFKAIGELFTLSADTEITLEANPGTLSPAKLGAYRALGVNRLSLGIQSFNDDELRFLGRIHDRRQAVEAIEQARSAGFDNLSLDLIFALPGQSVKRWQASLTEALSFRPEHISAYNLIFEQGTPFYSRMLKGEIRPQKPEQELVFLKETIRQLRGHGYEPYEVSNYARGARYISRHNYKYWNHSAYLGLGPSAHSYWQKERRANVRSLSRYMNMLDNGQLPLIQRESLTPATEEFEFIFLSLRTYDGLDTELFSSRFQKSFLQHYAPVVQQLVERGLARQQANKFRLTQEGMYLCDEILPQFSAN